MAKRKVARETAGERAAEILKRLRVAYPDACCSLDHRNALELLVATILAAQCTDERVNVVTKSLFAKYRSAKDYAGASQAAMEEAIRSCGFYRNKAKSIQGTCRALVERFGGKVPGTMEELLELEGVGRKTANVILGECFGVPGIIVDTHCKRLARRMGLTKEDDPAKIEKDLMDVLPERDWTVFSHCMVFHGREVCAARGPACSRCVLRDLCPFPETAEGQKTAR